MENNENKRYDIIGDIHGHFDKLANHLKKLGYRRKEDGTIHHPEGRTVLFLGDYIDRGEHNRETLHLVKEMVDTGTAKALMGNHEFNAVLMETRGPDGKYLRPSSESTDRTRAEFNDFPGEWNEWINWFKELPMWLDFGDFRAVHANWDEKSMNLIGNRTLKDDNFLIAAGTKGTPEFNAVEVILKGHELRLPEGVSFLDKDGNERTKTRARWWGFEDDTPLTFGDIAMPPGSLKSDERVPIEKIRTIPRYPEKAPPVFVGHYWMDRDAPKEPVGPNVIILDYSAGIDGPIVSYRWDPDEPISKEAFIVGDIGIPKIEIDSETTIELRASIRTTAFTMMENAAYMLKEIPRVEFSGTMGEKIREASEKMIGTKHDVFSALHDLDEFIEEKDATDRIRNHFSMILEWIREDIKVMHGLTGEIYAEALKDNRFHLGFTLVVESAVNIITTANPCFKTFNEFNIAA